MNPERVQKRNPHAWRAVGGLSAPSKMPCFGISLPASACNVGSALAAIVGSVCSVCYALKGRYIMPNVLAALRRRLRALNRNLESGRWERAMITLLSDPGMRANGFFRWHDSGDVQSFAHLEAIARVAIATPWIRHWLPTREARHVNAYLNAYGAFPANLNVRLSLPMMDLARPATFDPRIPTSTAHTSTAPLGAWQCPAPKQNGHCGPCRACWTPDVKHVSYAKH